MKKIMLCFATTLFFTLMTFAQNPTNSGTQGTESSSPSMQQSTPDQSMQNGNTGTTANNTEKKVKGCVAQQNGQYVLETHHGKTIPLSGEDVSAHVGHTVEVHGMWASSSAGTATASGTSAKSFDVTKVDMISDSCSMKGSTGTGSSSTTPQ
jgi:hypothetical protein